MIPRPRYRKQFRPDAKQRLADGGLPETSVSDKGHGTEHRSLSKSIDQAGEPSLSHFEDLAHNVRTRYLL